jgi:hypothetical protein
MRQPAENGAEIKRSTRVRLIPRARTGSSYPVREVTDARHDSPAQHSH